MIVGEFFCRRTIRQMFRREAVTVGWGEEETDGKGKRMLGAGFHTAKVCRILCIYNRTAEQISSIHAWSKNSTSSGKAQIKAYMNTNMSM